MQSKATTVEQYLAELPEDRRAALSAVRQTIRANIDKDVEECMNYGMIGYVIPHRVYPPGYHCNPALGLPFAGLASQKNAMSIYLMTVYGDESDDSWFRERWAKTGKKLDMGKCCIRFKKLEDVALDVIGEAIRRVSAKDFIAHYEKSILTQNRSATAKRAAKGISKTSSAKSASKATAKSASAKPGKKAAKKATKRVVKKAATGVAKPAAKKKSASRARSR